MEKQTNNSKCTSSNPARVQNVYKRMLLILIMVYLCCGCMSQSIIFSSYWNNFLSFWILYPERQEIVPI